MIRTLYLAGPEVFLPDAAAVGARKKVLAAELGFEGLFPLDEPADGTDPLAIYRACRAMMERADAILANLTPFRGSSADVGTVFELGWFIGRNKPAFAYTNASDDLLDRLRRVRQLTRSGAGWTDEQSLAIEDFGNADNLMLDMSLLDQACRGLASPLVRAQQVVADPARDLLAYGACLKSLAEIARNSPGV